jgi:HAD superfamily hydrolase (TIGR01490 family)
VPFFSGHEATPAGGESGGRRTVRLRGGRAGSVTHESLRAASQSYQPVIQPVSKRQPRGKPLPLCCRIVGTSVEGGSQAIAAFFDLDKTIISRSSTLAFGPSFYRHGLITRSQAFRSAFGQLIFRLNGADHQRMERIRREVGALCRGWPADRVSEIVARHLDQIILPHVYAEAHRLITSHRDSGQDVIVVSSSGQEMVGPIGAWLGATEVIATKMAVADGRYTGEMEFWAYGEAKADKVRELALQRGYRLPDCYAYSDSVTDLPLLEAVGHPHAVNPDRALRRIARERRWPVLTFGGRLAARPASMSSYVKASRIPPVQGM